MRNLLPAGVATVKKSSQFDWRLSGKRPHPNPLSVKLRDLGLMGCGSDAKFIPSTYKFASVSSRSALLQGLLDTDGCVRRSDNNIEYTTVSPALARDVAFLVQSLGGTARVRTKPTSYIRNGERTACKLAYRMSVILPPQIQPFRLGRKAAIYKPRPNMARVGPLSMSFPSAENRRNVSPLTRPTACTSPITASSPTTRRNLLRCCCSSRARRRRW